MTTQIPAGFGLYDVESVDHPLVITHEHAEEIGAKLHEPDGGPKPGSKAALVEQAEELGLSTDGTKAELEARIADALADRGQG